MSTVSGEAHFDQSGNLIASFSSGDNTARVWSREESGQFSLAAVFQQDGVHATAFNGSGSLLATSTYDDGSVGVWDISERRIVARIVGNTGHRSVCRFDERGRLVTAFSNDERRHADYFAANTTYIHIVPDNCWVAIWDASPFDLDPNLVSTWVEIHTGTKWAPNLPGGVDGLTEAEWNQRRSELIRALGTERHESPPSSDPAKSRGAR